MARRTQSARDQPSEAVHEDAAALLVLQTRFGERLRQARLAMNMTQAELAKRSGVHDRYIGRVELGRKNLTLGTMLRLATVVGCKVGNLLSEAEAPFDGQTD